jgi:hypothetical protein
MNTYTEKQYIIYKYKKLGVLDKDGKKTIPDGHSDYNIYPDNYIPVCEQCLCIYDMCKDKNPLIIRLNHDHCFWFEYFKEKILEKYPFVEFKYIYYTK